MVNATSPSATAPLLTNLLQGAVMPAAAPMTVEGAAEPKTANFSALLDLAGRSTPHLPEAAAQPADILKPQTFPATPAGSVKPTGKELPVDAAALPVVPEDAEMGPQTEVADEVPGFLLPQALTQTPPLPEPIAATASLMVQQTAAPALMMSAALRREAHGPALPVSTTAKPRDPAPAVAPANAAAVASAAPEVTRAATPLSPGVAATRLAPIEIVTPAPQQALPASSTTETVAIAAEAKPTPPAHPAAPPVAIAQVAGKPAPKRDDFQTEEPVPQVDAPAGDIAPRIVAADLRPGAAPVASAPAATTPPAPAHDFAALVDRIAQAREMSAAHVVRTALHHADFGTVGLQMRQDEGLTTVTFSSADPAFAPTVQAAAASAMSAQTSDDTRREPQPRQDTQQQQQQPATSQNGTASQQGQHQPAQTRAEAEARAHPRSGQPADTSPRSARQQGADTPERRPGIYA